MRAPAPARTPRAWPPRAAGPARRSWRTAAANPARPGLGRSRCRAAVRRTPRGKTPGFPRRQVVVEAEALRQVPDPPPGGPRRRLPEQPHRTAGDRQQAEQHADQGGLARAVGAEQPDHLARADRQVYPVDRGEPAEDPAHPGAFGEYLGVDSLGVDYLSVDYLRHRRPPAPRAAPRRTPRPAGRAAPAPSPGRPGAARPARRRPAARPAAARSVSSGRPARHRDASPGRTRRSRRACPAARVRPASRTSTCAARAASSR